MAEAVTLLAQAVEGRSAILLLEGRPGLGKSRLVQLALSVASASGVRALHAAGDELEQRRPFGVIGDALEAAVPERWCHDRARVLRWGPPAGADGILDEATAVEHHVVESIVALLDELCNEGPILVAVDDLQWSDPGSLLVLNRWSRVAEQLPSVLLAAYRPLPRPPFVGRLLERLLARGAVHRELMPLDDVAVDALTECLTGRPPGPGLRRLLGKAAGNPLFIMELVDGLQREGAIKLDARGCADADADFATPSLSLAILHRLRFLSDDTVPALRVAAVLGASFTFSELCLILQRRPAELLPWAEECLRAGLIAQHGDRLAFRHELIRDALYEDTAAAIRKALHLDVARALAASGAEPVRVAEHFLRGADEGDTEALEWVRQAAAEIVPRAPDSAAELLAHALRLAGSNQQARDLILAQRADCLHWLGRQTEAEAICREVLGRPHEPSCETPLRHCLIRCLLSFGRAGEAAAEAEAGAASAAVPEPARVRFEAWAAWARVFAGDLDGALDRAATVEARAEAVPDGRAVCHALLTQALVQELRGDPARALALAARADAYPDTGSPEEPIPFLFGIVRVVSLVDLGRLEEARQLAEVARRIADEGGARAHLVSYYNASIFAHYWAGTWDDALADLDAFLELVEETGVESGTIAMRSAGALIAVHRDDLGLAEAMVSAAEEDLARTGPQWRLEWMLLARALLLEAAGNVSQALVTLGQAWTMCTAAGLVSAYPLLGPDLVRIALAAGDRAAAEMAADALERAAGDTDVASLAGAALRARGLVVADHIALRASLDAYRQAPRPIELAQAAEEAAVAAARAGWLQEGHALFDEALDLYERLDAHRDAARAEARSRGLGWRRGRRGKRGRPEAGWASLTPTELRVVALVAEGLSNPQIAERMFISRHTVHAHLSRILAKLRLRSRVQIAAVAATRRVSGTSEADAALEDPKKPKPSGEWAPDFPTDRDPP